MRVLVMLIMSMLVLMFHRYMPVNVIMLLGEMQPNAKGHQDRGSHQSDGHGFTQNDGEQSTNKPKK